MTIFDTIFGKKSKPLKQITRTDISTLINTEIKNHTENISNIMAKTINDTTMSAINENATEIDSSVSGVNNYTGGDMTVTGPNSEIIMNQTATIDAMTTATVNLVSNSEATSALASQMAADVGNKVQNDSAIKQSMDAINKIADAQKSAGGPEQLLDSVMSTIGGVLGGGPEKTESQQITEITTKLNIKVGNTTINENNITNEITNKITAEMKNVNKQSCNLDASAANDLKQGDVTATGGGKIKIGQSLVVKTALNCILGAVNTSKAANDITNQLGAKLTSDTSNTTKTDTAVKSANDVSKTVEKGSAIMDTVDTGIKTAGSVANTGITTAGSVANNAISTGGMLVGMWFLIPICGICCCCFIVLAIIYMVSSGGGGGSNISIPSIEDISALSDTVSKFK